jgi:hypothetical protein
VKKLILLPFLVFGQFIAHAQKPAKNAQQVITMNLMPAGPIHLPKTKGKGKDKDQTLQEQVALSLEKNLLLDKQVSETVIEGNPDATFSNSDKKNEEPATSTKNRTVIYTITSL